MYKCTALCPYLSLYNVQVYLLTGGYDTGYLSSTELLVHGASSWTSSGPLPSPRRYLRGAALNNKIVVTGTKQSKH